MGTRAADFRTCHYKSEMLRLDMFSAYFKAVAHSGAEAGLVAAETCFNAMPHIALTRVHYYHVFLRNSALKRTCHPSSIQPCRNARPRCCRDGSVHSNAPVDEALDQVSNAVEPIANDLLYPRLDRSCGNAVAACELNLH